MFKLAAFAIAGALITAHPPSSTVSVRAAAKNARAVSAAALRRFEPNDGQFPRAVRFVSRTPRGTLVLGARDAALQLRGATVRMNWTGKSAAIRGVDPLPGVQHYLVGDRAHWRRGVPGFGRVKYADVTRGIDLEFYGADEGFEYDIVVRPGAELSDFSLRFDGVTRIEEEASGDLVLSTTAGPVHQRRPIAFQDIDGRRIPVTVRYEIDGNRLAFRAGSYDRTRTLVIDPTLAFSTFHGGSSDDRANAVAVDAAGFIYVAGSTASVDFPTASAMRTSGGGEYDAFVSKLTPDGASLVYSTYLGGSGLDQALGLAVSGAGAAYVAGLTNSANFPVANAFQTTSTASSGFVSRLTPDGSDFVFSTYLGGTNNDEIFAIAIDAGGAAYVTGVTGSADFPLNNALQTTPGGSFVTKFSSTGSLVYSTYFGSRASAGTIRGAFFFEVRLHAIAVDAAGSAYVGGSSLGATIPVSADAYQRRPSQANCPGPDRLHWGIPGGQYPCADGVVAKLSPSGALGYATYLGDTASPGRDPSEPNATDIVSGITVDPAGFAYVYGTTFSRSFPTTPGAVRQDCGAARCAGARTFVTKFNQQGSGLVYSAVLGSVEGQDTAAGPANVGDFAGGLRDLSAFAGGPGIALDALGQAIVTGWTTATDFPLLHPHQATMASPLLLATTDGGAAWAPLSGPPGLDPISVRHAIDGTIYAIARPHSSSASALRLFKSGNGGATWAELDVSAFGGSTAFDIAVDPNNANVLYTQRFKTTDAGASWTPLGEILGSVPRARPGAASILFAVNLANGLPGNRVRKSVDGGATWTDSSNGITPQSGLAFTDVQIAPSSPNTMYVHGSDTLYASTDGGASWTSRTFPLATNAGLAVDRAQPSTLYGASVNGLYKSTDGGFTWGLKLAVATRPVVAATATTIYTATFSASGGRIYRSTNAGEDWTIVRGDGASVISVNLANPADVIVVTPGFRDAFVAALSADGSSVVYASYLGGARDDRGIGLTTTTDGAVVVAGGTFSTDFPVTSALQPANGGSEDAFVAKLRFPQPLINVDEPVEGATVFQPFRIGGWAVDRGAASDPGIDGVHIWAYRDGGGAPTFIAAAVPNVARPDLAAWLGPQFGTSGFNAQVSGLTPGTYTFAIYAHSSVTNTFAPPIVRRLQIVSGVVLNIDIPSAGSTTYSGLNIGGWAIDRGSATDNGIDSVHVWAYPNPGSGQAPIFLGVAATGTARPDVGAIFGSRFTSSGFNLTIPTLTPGPYLVAVFPYSTVTNSFAAPATVLAQIGDSRPNGSLDVPANGATVSGAFTVAGWALDAAAPSGTGVDAVDVWAFPVGGGAAVFLGRAAYGVARPDVGAIYGSAFTPSGYGLDAAALPSGTYDIVAYARSTVAGGFNSTRVARIMVP